MEKLETEEVLKSRRLPPTPKENYENCEDEAEHLLGAFECLGLCHDCWTRFLEAGNKPELAKKLHKWFHGGYADSRAAQKRLEAKLNAHGIPTSLEEIKADLEDSLMVNEDCIETADGREEQRKKMISAIKKTLNSALPTALASAKSQGAKDERERIRAWAEVELQAAKRHYNSNELDVRLRWSERAGLAEALLAFLSEELFAPSADSAKPSLKTGDEEKPKETAHIPTQKELLTCLEKNLALDGALGDEAQAKTEKKYGAKKLASAKAEGK